MFVKYILKDLKYIEVYNQQILCFVSLDMIQIHVCDDLIVECVSDIKLCDCVSSQ